MYTGLTGRIDLDGEKVAYISNWSIEDTADVIEITALGETFKMKKAGLQGWSASADGAVSFEAGKSQKDIFKAKHTGKKVLIEVYLRTADTTAIPAVTPLYFKGYGFIESLSVDLSAEDKGNISISISGSGELLLYEGESLLAGQVKNLDIPV